MDKYQRQEIFEEEHPVIRRAHRGDLIRVIRYVPDRHGLKVRAFQITLFHKSPVVDKDEDSEGGNCFKEPTADNHLTDPAKDIHENQKEEESDEEAAPPIEVTSVKNILCGGREEGVCFNCSPYNI